MPIAPKSPRLMRLPNTVAETVAICHRRGLESNLDVQHMHTAV
ncbi:hypothetical protein [Nostoc sp.]